MKKIGIVGWSTGDNSFGCTKPYLEYFSSFGQVEILMPRPDMVKGLDLLVLPGGMDTNPANYNQAPSFYAGNNDTFKEYFFRTNLSQYIQNEVPIFGVCLGMQQLNVHFGGTLVQHADFGYSSKSRDELVETLIFTDKFHFKDTKYKINSLHHQGVMPENLSPELEILATSKEYGNVEIFAHKMLPIVGYQGHPEETWCEVANLLIRNLI
jgi:putative glutamine amidotransferase